MKCDKCGKTIDMTSKYFALSEVLSPVEPHDFFLCEDCAELVTPMELYMSNKIRMANSDDDAIEVNAVVVEEKPAHPTPEEIAVTKYPEPYHPTPEEIAAAEHVIQVEELTSNYDTPEEIVTTEYATEKQVLASEYGMVCDIVVE